MDFYYPNLNNDMWRIMGIIFYQDKDYFLSENKKAFCRERIIDFLNEKGIALFDTATAIRRLQDNASDKFLEVITCTDVKALLNQLPVCEAIATTGQKATDILIGQLNVIEPKVGGSSPFTYKNRAFKLFRMPSSSRAYPLKLEMKAEVYQEMFKELRVL